MYLPQNELRSHRESGAFMARLPQRRLLTNPLQFPCPPTDISKPQLARSFLYVSLTLRISYIVRGRIHIAVPKMLHSCKFTQRVYGSTASFRLQIPLRGSHIPRDRTLNTTVVITPSQTALENNDPT
jgi:hypothetical protein